MAKKKVQNKLGGPLFASILYILVGLLLIIFRTEMIKIAMTIVGAVFVVFGVLDLLKKNWTGGGISVLIGAAVIVLGWFLVKIVLLVLGILIAVKGVLAILEVVNRRGKKNALDLLFPILTVIAGLILAFGNGLDWLIIITGILLLADGLLGLFDWLKSK